MRHMRNMKKIITIIICFTLIMSLVGCTNNSEDIVPKDAAYLVIYSSMLKQDGGLYYISTNGDILSKCNKLKMQDLSRFEVKDNRIIISGERHNNTVIFDRNSALPNKDFLFLNNSKYTGVTAIASDKDKVFGIMNGNFSDGIYKNLLVLQALSGEVIKKEDIDIFAHKALYSAETAIIAGAYIEAGESSLITTAEIIDYTNTESNTYKYDEFKGFWDIVQNDDYLYCLAEGKNESRDTVVMIDSNDFSIIDQVNMPEPLINLFIYKDSIYAAGNSNLYIIDSNSREVRIHTSFDESLNTQDSYAYFAYELEGKAYIFLRYSQRQKENSQYLYGNLICVDLDNSNIQITQIKCDKKYKADTLFIILHHLLTKQNH